MTNPATHVARTELVWAIKFCVLFLSYIYTDVFLMGVIFLRELLILGTCPFNNLFLFFIHSYALHILLLEVVVVVVSQFLHL